MSLERRRQMIEPEHPQLSVVRQCELVHLSYEDHAISGASAQRPGFSQLLIDASARRFDVVVTEALDRLSRKLADVATLFDGRTSSASGSTRCSRDRSRRCTSACWGRFRGFPCRI